ncbi:MAG: response regulator [Nitrospirae bacterium]|nr:response regulator [Nitrospirota bacterium]
METILIVDDEQVLREMTSDAVKASGYNVFTAENGLDAITKLMEQKIDLVVSDIKMPMMDGLKLAREMNSLYPQIPLILVTGFADVDTAVKALKQGAMDFIPKPIEIDLLIETIKKNLEKSMLFQKRTELTSFLNGAISYKLPVSQYLLIEALTSSISLFAHQNGFVHGSMLNSTKTVLHEALTNAVYHGALGVPSEGIRDTDNGYHLFMEVVRIRVDSKEYKDKLVLIDIDINSNRMNISINDGGIGYDWKQKFKIANDPKSFLKPYGRGLLIMKGILGENCNLNTCGNTVTLTLNKMGG